MKVVILTACNSRSAGGLFFTITEYSKALKRLGVDVIVVGFNNEYSPQDLPKYGDVPVVVYDRVPLPVLSSFGYSTNLSKILDEISPEIIHVQGLWMYHSWAALRYRRRHPSTKIVIEPHGMLDPWALKNSGWKKKIVGHLFEYENLKKADCIHALCENEKRSIRDLGLENPIVILPNGVNLPSLEPKKYNDRENTFLFLGRIHPKKGIEQLIEAVALVRDREPSILTGWKFKIAGWDQKGHQQYVNTLVEKYSLFDYISFIGPIFGMDKVEVLSNSKAFVLPSLSEGLPMSVLEAWSYGIPSIMTEQCNLPEGFEANAAIKITANPKEIAAQLVKFLSMLEHEKSKMSQNAINLVKSHFVWSKIAYDTVKLYNQLVEKNNNTSLGLI